jgi:hypothetical protein
VIPNIDHMPDNPLTPQATAAFNARLDEIIGEIETDVLAIRQHFNARGLPYYSETVQKIYQRIDEAIAEVGKAASESARLAYEAGHHNFSENLEGELLNAFEGNFSSGFQRLCAVRISASQPIRDGLSNKQMLENDEHMKVARRAQIQGQLVLRQYFQTIKRARKRWYEHIPFFAKLALWLFKLH